jgi:type III pantothenate kinase
LGQPLGEGVKNSVILGFDIGNTSTKAGIYKAERIVPEATFWFPTVKNSDQAALSGMVGEGIAKQALRQGKADISGLVFSSVVPEINRAYHELAKKNYGIEALEISHKSRLNIRIAYDDPRELGVDRIVNAAAAFHEYGGGDIIVDIGTAVTFCVLLENGVFDGGVIAPGIDTAIKSLSGRASRLPEVAFEKPDRVVARDTVNSLKSGFFYGWISLAEGIIGRIRNEYDTDFRIILTGGYAPSVADHFGFETIVDPLLSMKGIKLIYDMNMG